MPFSNLFSKLECKTCKYLFTEMWQRRSTSFNLQIQKVLRKMSMGFRLPVFHIQGSYFPQASKKYTRHEVIWFTHEITTGINIKWLFNQCIFLICATLPILLGCCLVEYTTACADRLSCLLGVMRHKRSKKHENQRRLAKDPETVQHSWGLSMFRECVA